MLYPFYICGQYFMSLGMGKSPGVAQVNVDGIGDLDFVQKVGTFGDKERVYYENDEPTVRAHVFSCLQHPTHKAWMESRDS